MKKNKKLLGIIVVGLLISCGSESYSEINLKCDNGNVRVDRTEWS